jgi:hypothetical protein
MSKFMTFEYKTFDATSLSGSYQNLGSVATNPVRKLALWNTSDVDCIISTDGTTDEFYLPAGGTLFVDEWRSNANNSQASYVLRDGTQLEVKQVTGAGASGNIIAQLVM